MKALVCEMCNSSDVIKEGDFYVCQACGTKYTPEAAKKMMVEGTVKIDNSEKLKNLYQAARQARDGNDHENAARYYDLIIQEDPNSWEAVFYNIYCRILNCKIAEMKMYTHKLTDSHDTVLTLIQNTVTDISERKGVLEEISKRLVYVSEEIMRVSLSIYEEHSRSPQRETYVSEAKRRCWAAQDLLRTYGQKVVKFFGDEYGKDIAVPCWESAMYIDKCVCDEFNCTPTINYTPLIQKYDPSYQRPTSSSYATSSSGGCYVATAVYGSYDCPQVWTLRRYRDYTLAETWYGRLFIKTYYAISPTLVKWFGHTSWFKKMWKGKLDRMVQNLNARGVEDTPYRDKKW